MQSWGEAAHTPLVAFGAHGYTDLEGGMEVGWWLLGWGFIVRGWAFLEEIGDCRVWMEANLSRRKYLDIFFTFLFFLEIQRLHIILSRNSYASCYYE